MVSSYFLRALRAEKVVEGVLHKQLPARRGLVARLLPPDPGAALDPPEVLAAGVVGVEDQEGGVPRALVVVDPQERVGQHPAADLLEGAVDITGINQGRASGHHPQAIHRDLGFVSCDSIALAPNANRKRKKEGKNGRAWHGTAQHSTAQHGMVYGMYGLWYMSWHGMVRHGMVCMVYDIWYMAYGMAMAWHGMAQHGTVWYGMAW